MGLTLTLQVPLFYGKLTEMLNSGGATKSRGIYRRAGNKARMDAAIANCRATGGSLPQVGNPEHGGLTLDDVACMQKRFIRDLPFGLLHGIKQILLDLHGPRKDGSTLSADEMVIGYNAALRLLPTEKHFDLTLHLFSW